MREQMRQPVDGEEKTPFLGTQSPTPFRLDDEHESRRSQGLRKLCRPSVLLALASITVILFVSNFCLLLYYARHVRSDSVARPFSPADQSVAYELKSVETHDLEDRFTGPPGPDFDRAWSDLLTAGYVRVTPEELRAAGKQSLRIQDPREESYLGYLEVYHQLHCVKRMVQNRWPERYPELKAIHAFSDSHFNHCIQVLRKGIMCNGDTSFNTFRWSENNSSQIQGISNAPRKCIDWELMDSWARSRATGGRVQLYPEGEDGWLGPA